MVKAKTCQRDIHEAHEELKRLQNSCCHQGIELECGFNESNLNNLDITCVKLSS